MYSLFFGGSPGRRVEQMILTTTKIRQIILNLPDFFLYFLDEPVMLYATDQRRDTKKVPWGESSA
jgi:hypothetical protein